ncbi:MAG: DUF333 domain-containing protein [Candidatus Nanoarchaeia archaeon]|nr:DUF333 domain-containing protein [Candidatus Nanoarchaeia archaeon]
MKLLPILFLVLFISGCSNVEDNSTQIANPASVYCEDNGGVLEIRTAEDGSQTGYCKLADGTECEEWSYYNGECPKTQ